MTGAGAIHAGAVEWSGENPGMYLIDEAPDRFVTLVSLFRVVLSPHGRGHALILLESPLLEVSLPEALNVCVTDNEPLARWLVDNFVASFRAFRGVPLASMAYRRLTGVSTSGDQRSAYVEWVKGDGAEATLSWEALGAPYMVTLGPARSATGRHAMWSCFVDAARVTATVNGRRVVGRPASRDFHGRPSSTAFLAFADTWVRE
jgi:hypothetical protein